MHSVHGSDREAVASNNAGRAGHGDRLVTVVHVEPFSGRRGRADRFRDVVVVRGVASVDRDAGAGSRTNAVRVVELEGVEARNLADVGAVVSGQRLAGQRLTPGEVVRHAVVVAGGQSQVTRIEVDTLLIEDGFALGDIVKPGGSREALHNERSLSGSDVQNSHVDVARQLLLGGVTQTLFLKGVTEFSRRHDPRHRLVETNRCWDSQLDVVREVARHIRARVGLGNVGLGPPDHVVGAFHHRLIRVVDRDVAGQDECVLETFEEVFKGHPFFFAE